ncbi:hypothetical protein ABGB09_29665 [Streptomyces sp. B8F3]|uniref:VG15 protein n=1 Tax=Streptomyces sp. B8F3 TaxID=3153573 RepID=UPI00325CCD62
MTPAEYRRRQESIAAGVRAALAPLLRQLRGQPPAEQWQPLLDAVYRAVFAARVESWRLAADFYAAQRRTQLTPAGDSQPPRTSAAAAEPAAAGRLQPVAGGGQPEVPRRNYPPAAIAAALRPLRARLDALDAGAPPPEPAVAQALAAAERHARDAGREAIVDAARHDPAALGYARRALSGNPCAFCLMLVSRGPVYKTATSALLRDGGGEPYHDHCSCVAVPVFHRERWPGREQADDLQRQWREHGGTLAAWRRHIDIQRRAQPAAPAPPAAA